MPHDRPTYRELTGSPANSTWEYFGPGDALGCAALVSPGAIAAAAGTVVSGEVFRLDLPLELPAPPLFGRQAPRRTTFHLGDAFLDDWVDNFYLQASTQWDGLGHVADPQHGWYGGRSADDVKQGRLGIEHLAARGVAGRGVLADVARHGAAIGDPFDPTSGVVTPARLHDTLTAQNVSLRVGDVLLVRTGWLGWYLGLGEHERAELAIASVERNAFTLPGLAPGPEIAELLWDAGVSMVAVDAPSIDPLPRLAGYDDASDSAHVRLLARLGLYVGELFALDDLAAACARDDRWSCLFVSAPLRLQGALGSPANAMAIR